MDNYYHKQGISRVLFDVVMKICKGKISSLQTITVNSSPYAVKLGFTDISSEQFVDGIKFTPMGLET